MAEVWQGEATYKKLKPIIRKVIEKKIVQYIYEKMQEAIYSVVYNAYDPTGYDRRYDSKGGLADMNTYGYEIKPTANGFSLRVFTDSKAVGDNEGDSLDSYIVDGVYTWEESDIYKQNLKRDFYTATLDSMLLKGELFDLIRRMFAEEGIKIK